MQNRSGRTVTRGSKSRLQSLAYKEGFFGSTTRHRRRNHRQGEAASMLRKKTGRKLIQKQNDASGRSKRDRHFSPPPRPRLLDVLTVSRVRANTGVFASNVKQRTRVAFEQTDNL